MIKNPASETGIAFGSGQMVSWVDETAQVAGGGDRAAPASAAMVLADQVVPPRPCVPWSACPFANTGWSWSDDDLTRHGTARRVNAVKTSAAIEL